MVEDESVHESKKLPPDWIYNFDDSRLNIKTLTLDINKSSKREHLHHYKDKITPVPSVNEKLDNVHSKIKTEDKDSFR